MTSNNPQFDIEILEPLLLMSASPATAEVAEFSFGDEGVGESAAFAATESAEFGYAGDAPGPDFFGGDDGFSLLAANANNGESADDAPAVYGGNRADYTVEDQGFGIYAVRGKYSTDFVTDVKEISFRDGTFSINDLVPDREPDFGADNEVPEAPEFIDTDTRADTSYPVAIAESEPVSAVDVTSEPETDTPDAFPQSIDLADGLGINLPDSADMSVTFESEGAGYQNTVGYYTIDPDTGEIDDVGLLFANASAKGSGGSLISGQSDVTVSGLGSPYAGLFLLANGNAINDLSDIDECTLSLQPNNRGSLTLVAEYPDNRCVNLDGPVYTSTNIQQNPDSLQHFVFENTGSGVQVSIEDLPLPG